MGGEYISFVPTLLFMLLHNLKVTVIPAFAHCCLAARPWGLQRIRAARKGNHAPACWTGYERAA